MGRCCEPPWHRRVSQRASTPTLSVDTAQTFKTAPAAYEIVLQHFGAAASEVVFFSSNRWDIAGATSFGFDAVWVNRSNLPDEYSDLAPVRVIASLDEIS